jgi:hypothetical protein
LKTIRSKIDILSINNEVNNNEIELSKILKKKMDKKEISVFERDKTRNNHGIKEEGNKKDEESKKH